MRPPLWLDVSTGPTCAQLNVSLAVCRNCGNTKVTSDPCSLDHLAAILDFTAAKTPRNAHRGPAGGEV